MQNIIFWRFQIAYIMNGFLISKLSLPKISTYTKQFLRYLTYIFLLKYVYDL